MAAIKIPKDIKVMNFEETMNELEVMMNKLDVGGMTLEESTDCYIRCCLLRQHGYDILDGLRKKVLLYTGDKEKWEEFSPHGYRSDEPEIPVDNASGQEDKDPENDIFSSTEKESGSEDLLL